MRSNDEILDHLHASLIEDGDVGFLSNGLTADEQDRVWDLLKESRLITSDRVHAYERQIADLEQRRSAAVERETEVTRQRNIAISALDTERRLAEQVGTHTERVSALIERAAGHDAEQRIRDLEQQLAAAVEREAETGRLLGIASNVLGCNASDLDEAFGDRYPY